MRDGVSGQTLAGLLTVLYVGFGVGTGRRERFGEAAFEAIFGEDICFFGVADGVGKFDLMLHLPSVLSKRCPNA